MKLLNTLASYVPKIIIQHLHAHPGGLTEPFSETHQAATLFADISGFTPLTERLAQSGPDGAERLASILNDYFGTLIKLVYEYGGDIVKFAGDALLAVWPVTLHQKPLEELSALAVQCALAAQTALSEYQSETHIRLALRIGVGVGNIVNVHLGGQQNRWEFFLTGSGIAQASEAEKLAQPGHIAISPEVFNLIQEKFTFIPLENGFRSVLAPIVEIPPQPLPPPQLLPTLEAGMRAHIPGAILSRLSAGQASWLAELRRVTILFVNLPDLSADSSLEQGQQIMKTLQEVIYYYEGSINKLNVDDKGVTLLAVQGLPPLSHEDDAVRGVQTALELKNRLDKLNLRNSIGVTTGLVFCGVVGNTLRREYTLMGDVVNLAARLMMASANDILCDHTSFEATRDQLRFETLPEITVKGKAEPIQVYRPHRGQQKLTFSQPESELVGRYSERAILAGQLQAFLRGSQHGIIVLDGEAGIGKSRLLVDVLLQANKLGLYTLVGSGDAIEKVKPYHGWRSVFQKLLQLENSTDSQIRRAPLTVEMFKDPQFNLILPLLNDILPLELPDNDFIHQMTAEVRAENTRKLLVQLLQTQAQQERTLLVIDDAHWLDSSSWAVLQSVVKNVRPLLVVLATRPIPEPIPGEMRQINQNPDTIKIHLDTLPPEEILGLVCQSLGVQVLPESISAMIREKAQGNPFFSQELAYSLRDTGILRIVDGNCYLAPEVVLSTLNLPNTVQGAIISRVDRLGAQEQFTLKVASVIGRIFAYRTLQHIHPIDDDKPNLLQYLEKLEALDITPLDTPDPDLAYIFKHNITQEVVYNLLPFARRQELHRKIALWFEATFGDELTPYTPLLAHHWNRAGDPQKALHYLEKAGEQALQQYANQEAINFFSLCIETGEKYLDESQSAQNPSEANLRRARWERALGDAYLRLGQLATSEKHLRQALDLLGQPLPRSEGVVLLGLLGQVGQQFIRGFFPQKIVAEGTQKENLLETARVNHLLAEIFFFDQKTTAMIYTNLSTINKTEPAGPSPDLAEAYGSMGVAAGLIPLHGVAQSYLQNGQRVADNLAHLPSQAYARMVEGLYWMGLAEWEKVRPLIENAIEMFRRLGDSSRLGSSLILMADLHYLRGNYGAALALCEEVHQLGRRSGSPQQQAWGLGSQAEVVLRQGYSQHAGDAVHLIEEALALLSNNPDLTEETRNHGSLSLARLRQGEYQLAFEAAEAAVHLIAKSPTPTLFSVFEGYAAPPAVFLTLWQFGEYLTTLPPGSKPLAFTIATCKTQAARALKYLHQYARIFPIGRPRAALWQGFFDWLSGKPDKAFRNWEKGLETARSLGLPWEEARLLFELGRRKPAVDAQRQAYLREAEKIFIRLGAEYDRVRVAREIGAGSSPAQPVSQNGV
ncbi:MAG: AAA family ATPase [Anaerolineales bacterium]|nr:AAA family ATPase [Anaerolineales bacterium]